MRKSLIGFTAAALMLASSLASAATLYITEYKQPLSVTYQAALAVPAVAEQTISITGSSAQSKAFNAQTTIIRVHTDAICSVEIGGTNPVATTATASSSFTT